MGSSPPTKTTKKVSNYGYRRILPYKKRQETFLQNHEKFNLTVLTGHFSEEIPFLEQIEPRDLSANLAKLFQKYKSTLTKEKINESTFYKVMRELYAEPIIKKKIIQKDFDVFKIINSVYSKLKIGEIDNVHYKNALYSFEKEFDVNLIKINYSLLEMGDLPTEILLSLDRQLKFNKNYQPNILTLTLNEKLLSNTEIIDDLCDIIKNSQVLQIITLLIYPKEEPTSPLPDNYGLTCGAFQSLFRLIHSISKNRNIKGFFFHSIKDYNIYLAPEIFTKILSKLQSETLVAFHFGNFRLSESLLNKLMFQIASTRCLKFISLHLFNISKILDTKILDALKKNLSLHAFAITNLDFKEDKKYIDNFKKTIDTIIKKDDEQEGDRVNTITKTSNIEMYYLGEKGLFEQIPDGKIVPPQK